MNAKRVLPLALLHAADGNIEGKTRLQKLAFLAEKRLEEKDISAYDFVPYDYGPFSKDLLDEVEELEERGLVNIKESRTYGGDLRYDYQLTHRGWESCDRNFPPEDGDDRKTVGQKSEEEQRLETLYDIALDVVDEYNDYPISNLIDLVYDKYPRYAANSVY